MSDIVTMSQFMEFVLKRVKGEENDPKEAKVKTDLIKKCMKKYANKRLIHDGKDATAPTNEQWKKHLNRHKGKMLYYKNMGSNN